MANMSENTIKIIDFLKENHGKKMTSQEVATALDMSVSSINGAFTALCNKGLGVREAEEVPSVVEVYFLGLTDNGKASDTAALSEAGQQVVAYLRKVDGQKVTVEDAAEALGVDKRKFTGAFNALVKKGLATRTPAKVEGISTVKHLVLTDAGMAYTPEDAE